MIVQLVMKKNSRRKIITVPFVFSANHATLDGNGVSGETTSTVTVSWQGVKDTAHTVVTPIAMTEGTWVSSGFVQELTSVRRGLYQFGIPNAALDGRNDFVTFHFASSTANVEDTFVIIQLIRSLEIPTR